MPEPESSVKVLDNPDEHRYEAIVGDEVAGYLTYRAGSGAVVLVHTEVNAAFEGHGIGGRLAAAALEDARARGFKIQPLCPFVVAYLKRHPEFSDVVA
jgi:predicted GNAT family acetyltransferase